MTIENTVEATSRIQANAAEEPSRIMLADDGARRTPWTMGSAIASTMASTAHVITIARIATIGASTFGSTTPSTKALMAAVMAADGSAFSTLWLRTCDRAERALGPGGDGLDGVGRSRVREHLTRRRYDTGVGQRRRCDLPKI